jgi:hypothetical protein
MPDAIYKAGNGIIKETDKLTIINMEVDVVYLIN